MAHDIRNAPLTKTFKSEGIVCYFKYVSRLHEPVFANTIRDALSITTKDGYVVTPVT